MPILPASPLVGLPVASAFTLTCISELDLVAATRYYQALAQGASRLAQASLFRHYHQPTDTYDKLSEATLAMTVAAIWQTLGEKFGA